MEPVIFSAEVTDFHATLSARAADVLVLTLKGSAESDARDQLPRVLSTLDNTALSKHAKRVEVDFRDVEFMNSSCFKEFVAWLSKLKNRGAEGQYRVVLHSSSRVRWQRASMYALSCFASELVEVKAE